MNQARELWAAVFVGLVIAASVPVAGEDSGYEFSFPDDPNYLVLQYRSLVPQLPEAYDPTPSLRIYGDGRLRVHFHASFSGAPDWERQLSREEVERILSALAEEGVLELSNQRIAALWDQAYSEVQKERAISPLPRSPGAELTISLDGYSGASEGSKTSVQRLLCIPARLGVFSSDFVSLRRELWGEVSPSSPELARLFRAEQILLGLHEKEGLKKVPPLPSEPESFQGYVSTSTCFD